MGLKSSRCCLLEVSGDQGRVERNLVKSMDYIIMLKEGPDGSGPILFMVEAL